MGDGRGRPGGGGASWRLTHREQEVLDAVARRLTNAEIAAELLISKRTVESHVGALLAKLGAGDRLALVRAGASAAPRTGTALAPPARPPSPEALRPPLVGREVEREVLLDHLVELLAGTGGVVLVSGEPGIGKTRLVEELLTEAEASGARCLVGRSRNAGERAPLSPVAELLEAALRAPTPLPLRQLVGGGAGPLAALVPRLSRRLGEPPVLPSAAAEVPLATLVSAVVGALGRLARSSPLVVVLEDVHRADPATLEVLRGLSEAAARAPLLVVATHRDTTGDVLPHLAPLLHALARRVRPRALVLQPLDEAAVGRVVTTRSGRHVSAAVRRALHRRTGGNPLFLVEAVALLDGVPQRVGPGPDDALAAVARAVPATAGLAVGQRLARLSGPTRSVLQTAAVVGERIDPAVLALAVAERGPGAGGAGDAADAAEHLVAAALDEARAAGLLAGAEPSGGATALRHQLVRDVLLAQVSAPRRRRTHLRVAQALLSSHPPRPADVDVAVAEHLVAAGALADQDEVLRRCVAAGRRFLDLSDGPGALRLLEHAEGLDAAATHPSRGELHQALAAARSRAGRPEEAVRSWERALDAFEQAGDLVAVGAVSAGLGLALARAARETGTRRVVERSAQLLAAAAGAGPPPDGHHDEQPDGHPDGHPDEQRAVVLARLGAVRAHGGDPDGGAALVGRAQGMLEHVSPRAAAAVLADAAGVAHAAFRTAEAARAGLRGAALARRAQSPEAEADCLWEAAWDLAALGRLEEAAEASARLDALLVDRAQPGLLVCAGRARAVLELLPTGDLDGYAESARRDTALVRDGLAGAWLGTSHAFTAHSLLLGGHWERAAELAALGPVGVGPPLAGFCTGVRLVVLGHLRRRSEVERVLAEHAHELPAPGRTAHGGAWGLALGAVDALAAVGLHDRAAALHPTVLEAQRTSGALVSPFPPLQLLDRVVGTAAACAGRWDQAEEHFARALRDAASTPLAVELPETRRALAEALLRRGSADDADRARELAGLAATGYDRLGMPRHASLVRALVPVPGQGSRPDR